MVGVATWKPGERAELVSLGVLAGNRGRGIGGHLVERVVEEARDSGSAVVWLVTTNDNLDALALYQRHGFRLARLVVGGVDAARRTQTPDPPPWPVRHPAPRRTRARATAGRDLGLSG